MRLLQFGGIVLPQLNGQFNSPVAYRSSVVALQNGGFDQDGNDSYLESKVISYQFWLSPAETAVSAIDTMIENLYREASQGRRRLLAIKRDGTVVSALCKLVQAQVGVDSRLWAQASILPDVVGYDTMAMTFELSYPYWLAVEDESKLLDAGWVADGSFTFAISDSVETITLNSGTLSDSIVIDNTGNTAHERLIITITAQTGVSATSLFNITNSETGQYIEWFGSLVDGDVLVIQTLLQTVKINGDNDYVNAFIPSGQIPFLSVQLGTNTFAISFGSITGGDVEVSIEHARHYVR